MTSEIEAIRKAWRRRWSRFVMLRCENFRRAPSWRVEAETEAWHQSREAVKQYANARGWITA